MHSYSFGEKFLKLTAYDLNTFQYVVILQLNIFLKKIYLFILERERMSRGRVRERESQADSPLSAEPTAGLNLTALRS